MKFIAAMLSVNLPLIPLIGFTNLQGFSVISVIFFVVITSRVTGSIAKLYGWSLILIDKLEFSCLLLLRGNDRSIILFGFSALNESVHRHNQVYILSN